MKKLKHLRKDYNLQCLQEADLNPDPMVQFDHWFHQVLERGEQEPNVFVLATISNNQPRARVLLLKAYDHDGFIFTTNYNSKKGQELAHNAHASMVFWWREQERQVRVEGVVSLLSETQSDEYFNARPLQARLAAITSPQSEPITKEILTNRYDQICAIYANNDNIPRPKNWGGYHLKPTLIEFWQGGQHRLHDRLCYCLNNKGQWEITRLAP